MILKEFGAYVLQHTMYERCIFVTSVIKGDVARAIREYIIACHSK
jgi:hypothetical protein